MPAFQPITAVLMARLKNPGELIVSIAHAAIKRIRNRPGAVARRARKAAKKAAKNPLDEVAEDFNQPDEGVSMNWSLLIAFAGSIARHFLPWATALLAGMGIQVSPEASPLVTLALAIGVYAVMQGVSLWRQWQKREAE